MYLWKSESANPRQDSERYLSMYIIIVLWAPRMRKERATESIKEGHVFWPPVPKVSSYVNFRAGRRSNMNHLHRPWLPGLCTSAKTEPCYALSAV